MNAPAFNGDDNRDSLTTPEIAADEFDGEPADDEYVYSDDDLRNFHEAEMDLVTR